ncbi:hypothetical protein KIPB_009977, partial [Kipferlia bialata]
LSHALGERDTAFIGTVSALLDTKHVREPQRVATSILNSSKDLRLPYTLLGASLVTPKAGERYNPALHHVAAGETDGVDTVACTLAPGVAIQGVSVAKAHVVLGRPGHREWRGQRASVPTTGADVKMKRGSGRGGEREKPSPAAPTVPSAGAPQQDPAHHQAPVPTHHADVDAQAGTRPGGQTAPPKPDVPATLQHGGTHKEETHTASSPPTLEFVKELAYIRVTLDGVDAGRLTEVLHAGRIPLSGPHVLDMVRKLSSVVTETLGRETDPVMREVLASKANTPTDKIVLLSMYVKSMCAARAPIAPPMQQCIHSTLVEFHDLCVSCQGTSTPDIKAVTGCFAQVLASLEPMERYPGCLNRFLTLERTAAIVSWEDSLCTKECSTTAADLFLRHGCFRTPPTSRFASASGLTFCHPPTRDLTNGGTTLKQLLSVFCVSSRDHSHLALLALAQLLEVLCRSHSPPRGLVREGLVFIIRNKTPLAPAFRRLSPSDASMVGMCLGRAAHVVSNTSVTREVEGFLAEASLHMSRARVGASRQIGSGQRLVPAKEGKGDGAVDTFLSHCHCY